MTRFHAAIVLLATLASAAAQAPSTTSAPYLKKRAERIMAELDYEFALRHLGRAIELHPKDADFRMLLGEAYFALERWGPATETFEAGIGLDAGMVTRAPHYPLSLVNSGRLDDARRVYGLMLEGAEDDAGRAQAEFGLGLVLYHRGEVEKAVGHLERARALDPDSKKTLYRLGLALRVLGRLDEARGVLGHVVELDGLHEPAIHNLAMIAVQRKDREAARRWRDEHRRVRATLERLDGLMRALAAKRGDPALLRAIADIHFAARRWDEARGPYSSLVTLFPLDPEPRYLYAMCQFNAGRFHEARMHLQRVLYLQADHPGALRAMAVITERFGKEE